MAPRRGHREPEGSCQDDSEPRARFHRNGRLERASVYDQGPDVVKLAMIEDGLEHLPLGEVVSISSPVRLIHGLEDPDVPWEISLRLCDRPDSEDVRVVLVKGGGHRLSGRVNLDLLTNTVAEVLPRERRDSTV